MTSEPHHKHSKIARPAFGKYCRNEWSVVGSNCNTIQRLAAEIINALAPQYKAVYLDATHNEETADAPIDTIAEYTSYPTGEQFFFHKKFTDFRFRELFNEADFALVNGNHLQAKAQVIIIDEAKRASLHKRMENLTNVQLILLSDEQIEIFDFLKAGLPHIEEIPVFLLSERDKIAGFFQSKLQEATPPLFGLVLAGGQSMRMGHDKTAIQWHGKEQRYYMADQLQPFAKEVFISCRAGQEKDIDDRYKTLPDSFTDLGPFGAILSSFRYNPDAAWLVIASDLPLLDTATLDQLVTNRNPAAVATTFVGADGQPEPLITIWEPKSYLLLLAQLAQGYSCPRKLLLNNDIHLITAADQHALMNVNTPGQALTAKQLLSLKLSKA